MRHAGVWGWALISGDPVHVGPHGPPSRGTSPGGQVESFATDASAVAPGDYERHRRARGQRRRHPCGRADAVCDLRRGRGRHGLKEGSSKRLVEGTVRPGLSGVAEPDDLAAMVIFLAGFTASQFTGHAASISGGISAA